MCLSGNHLLPRHLAQVRQRWEVDVDRVLLAILVRGTWPFPFKHRVLAGGSLETPLHLRSLVEKGTHCRALSLRLSQWCYPTHNIYIYIYIHMYIYNNNICIYIYIYAYIIYIYI